ncbi:MAG TPA: hypothetical protein VGQ93_02225 [Lysobacter sp.]|jgi:hypothetical protein|nr:hypothetical protein [Lysobacter sp.]
MTPRIRSTALSLALATTALMAHASEPVANPAASKAVISAAGAILQGNSAEALRRLREVPAEAFSGDDARIRSCMIERFDREAPPPLVASIEDPFARAVLATYQNYWWQAFTHPTERQSLEAGLLASLRTLLGDAGKAPADLDALEDVIQTELERRGYHAQLGAVTPLRDLMLWRTQTTREFEVPLLDAPYRVRAELLDDFASIGWSHFGTCGKAANGGWATEDTLYAIMPRYKEGIDGDSFQIVFLGHETQHLADKNRFPGMQDWELEYRAKLAELARATGELSQKRLLSMTTAQGDSPEAAHPYANTHVVQDLTKKLGQSPDTVPIEALQKAAKELLLDDSRRRQAAKA